MFFLNINIPGLVLSSLTDWLSLVWQVIGIIVTAVVAIWGVKYFLKQKTIEFRFDLTLERGFVGLIEDLENVHQNIKYCIQKINLLDNALKSKKIDDNVKKIFLEDKLLVNLGHLRARTAPQIFSEEKARESFIEELQKIELCINDKPVRQYHNVLKTLQSETGNNFKELESQIKECMVTLNLYSKQIEGLITRTNNFVYLITNSITENLENIDGKILDNFTKIGLHNFITKVS